MAQAAAMLIALLTTKRVSKAGSSPACEAVKWRHQQHSLAMETSAKSSLGLPSRKQQLGNSLQTSSTCPAWSRTADPASCSDGAKSAGVFRECQLSAGCVVMQFFQMEVTVPRCHLRLSSEVLSLLEQCIPGMKMPER